MERTTQPVADRLGEAYVEAVVSGDADRIRGLLTDDVDFRAVTPRRAWEATTPDDVLDIVLGHWFPAADGPRELVKTSHDMFADRERVDYRMLVHGTEGDTLVEQTAYYSVRDGRIGWMRIACSGFRPVDAD
ncbi:MAG: nuclear transport factor 2 family protein [Nocardioides sp.]